MARTKQTSRKHLNNWRRSAKERRLSAARKQKREQKKAKHAKTPKKAKEAKKREVIFILFPFYD